MGGWYIAFNFQDGHVESICYACFRCRFPLPTGCLFSGHQSSRFAGNLDGKSMEGLLKMGEETNICKDLR